MSLIIPLCFPGQLSPAVKTARLRIHVWTRNKCGIQLQCLVEVGSSSRAWIRNLSGRRKTALLGLSPSLRPWHFSRTQEYKGKKKMRSRKQSSRWKKEAELWSLTDKAPILVWISPKSRA